MYVNEQNRPLTFEDLTRAVRRSAGLGQADLSALNALPLMGQTGQTPFDTAVGNASITGEVYPGASIGPTGAVTPFQAPWGTLALVASGLILFGLVVGNPK